ncbi:MAG: choice-of-anchor W domain-containing protein [Pseudomonadota bacterium]
MKSLITLASIVTGCALMSTTAMATPVPLGEAGFAKFDQTSNGTRGRDVGFNGITTADFTWTAGAEIDWSYEFDGATLTFTWGDATVSQALTTTDKFAGFGGYVRNTARSGLPDDFALTVDIGPVGGTDLAPITANLGDDFVNFEILEDLGSTFSVSGTAVADWTGTIDASPNSRFAFQIDALIAEAVDVNEPGALALLGLGLLGMQMRRKRRLAA